MFADSGGVLYMVTQDGALVRQTFAGPGQAAAAALTAGPIEVVEPDGWGRPSKNAWLPLERAWSRSARHGPYVFGIDFANLVLARLYEARGDRAAALRAARRRPYDWDTGPLYLTTFLKEEGRLAALTGDRVGAKRAWAQFLALRAGADAVHQVQTDGAARADAPALTRAVCDGATWESALSAKTG